MFDFTGLVVYITDDLSKTVSPASFGKTSQRLIQRKLINYLHSRGKELGSSCEGEQKRYQTSQNISACNVIAERTLQHWWWYLSFLRASSLKLLCFTFRCSTAARFGYLHSPFSFFSSFFFVTNLITATNNLNVAQTGWVSPTLNLKRPAVATLLPGAALLDSTLQIKTDSKKELDFHLHCCSRSVVFQIHRSCLRWVCAGGTTAGSTFSRQQ